MQNQATHSPVICGFGTAPEQALAGYRLVGTATGTESEVLEQFKAQDVRLVRGASIFGAEGKHEFGVMQMQPIRRLRCVCCGESVRGRQWHGQDSGWGLGSCCMERCQKQVQGSDFRQAYGVQGIHFDLPAEENRHEIRLDGEHLAGGDQTSIAMVWKKLTGRQVHASEDASGNSGDPQKDYLSMMEKEWSCKFADGSVITLCDQVTGLEIDTATVRLP
ncbi:hypothetical protein ACRCPS_17520 [Pseudomonas aeruginosa]